MINKKVAKMLNEQITQELYSSYLYLSMSVCAKSIGLWGLANWMYVQYQEEHAHAMHIVDYLIDQNVEVEFEAMEKPKNKWKSAVEILKDTLAHEKMITECYTKLMDTAIAEKDYASINFMQWYIKEQVEEEASALELLNKYEMVDKTTILFLDKELLERKFIPPFE